MKKETQYQCFDCGTPSKYSELKKRLTYTENFKVEHYNHKCPACGGRKFIILSIVERV